ncbi:hypothetical protein [Pandoraea anhela]|uniref:Uncharacterized protein n=1 Tax=Pandoraea anhela TaxID=2508295 RepID=A0A5E4VI88_9BURK|nr:hypothetical protein [Pandoraea anhela]VVE12038.1 hypothetical protein PAN31108_02676 [Pandoraea anhela]
MKLSSKLTTLFSKPESSTDSKAAASTSTASNAAASTSAQLSHLRPAPKSGNGAAPRQPHSLTIARPTTFPVRAEQQATHELQVKNGLVYQNNRRFSTGEWEETRFVMGADGKMFADRPDRGDVPFPDNHTSFLRGEPAAAAGELTAHGGVIETMNNFSGHYAPTNNHTKQMLSELESRGVDTTKIKTTAF